MAAEVKDGHGSTSTSTESSIRGEVFGSLFEDESSSSDDESYYTEETVGEGPKSLVVSLHIPEEDKVQRTLFANAVWSGSKVLARYIWNHQDVFAGKNVCEFGSAAGLPGIVAGKVGANAVVLSDYPSDHLLANLQENAFKNLNENKTEYAVVGHIWGDDIRDLLKPLGGTPGENANENEQDQTCNRNLFDIVLASECLWCHDLHENLLLSIHSTLKAGGIALITFSHHIPGLELQDLSFFEKAKKMGFQSKFIKTFTGQAMWSDKMVQLYLYSLEKP